MISSGFVETVKISDLKKMISCGVLTTADLKLEEDQFWIYFFEMVQIRDPKKMINWGFLRWYKSETCRTATLSGGHRAKS